MKIKNRPNLAEEIRKEAERLLYETEEGLTKKLMQEHIEINSAYLECLE